ncbi:hypothetical protein CCACVL1_13089 [Corchorus capsularis]|uniref:Uncharacterized protein n=1 Tax=Corchorus capsularis TaxID=210143 RepID=A0A1R3ICR7_COCAP|nr:hypothetical protein CCACVL1_13089 [Corchorus capsularis]
MAQQKKNHGIFSLDPLLAFENAISATTQRRNLK